MDSDKITITVMQNIGGSPEFSTYTLTYEQFGLIKPVLDEAEKESKQPYNPGPDIPFPAFLGSLFGLPQNQQPQPQPVEYDISMKPDNMTLEQVMEWKQRYNVLLIQSDEDKKEKSVVYDTDRSH